MTPRQLRDKAAAEDARGEDAISAGDSAAAAAAFRKAELYRAVADELDDREMKRLPRPPKMVKSDHTMMSAEHREAISKGHIQGPNMDAARKAGYRTVGALAEAIGVSRSFLSHVLNGRKALPEDRAAKFRELTGRHWQ